MAANRLIYLAALIAATTFYFASTLWFSWVILVVALALPWVSLLLTLPAMLCCRLTASAPALTEQDDQASFRLRLRAPRLLPLPELQLRLTLTLPSGAEDARYLSRLGRSEGRLTLPTAHCGQIAYRLDRGRVYDYLGLFWLPKRVAAPGPTVVLPHAQEPVPMPDVEQFLHLQLKPKPGGGYAEIHDHRPYREGDPVRSIHWKLSMKTEDLIVREPMEPVRRTLLLLVQTPNSDAARDSILGQLRFLSAWLQEHALDHTVAWMSGTAYHTAEVKPGDPDDRVVTLCCQAPPDSAPLPEGRVQADWVYAIRQKGGGL